MKNVDIHQQELDGIQLRKEFTSGSAKENNSAKSPTDSSKGNLNSAFLNRQQSLNSNISSAKYGYTRQMSLTKSQLIVQGILSFQRLFK